MPPFTFFGSPQFAVYVLDKIVEAGFIPRVLVCNPDKPVGRKATITPPLSKQFITKKKLETKIIQPETKKDLVEMSDVFSECEVAVVVAYSKIIPDEVLSHFPNGVIGVHPSLLPLYRGASPIQEVILQGDSETGVSLYRVDAEVDHGPIFIQEKIEVAQDDTYLSLEKKLGTVGGSLLVKYFKDIMTGAIQPEEQNHSHASLTRKFSTQDGFVDLEKDDPAIIARKIRALNPEPGVHAFIDNVRTKLLEVKKIDEGWVVTSIIPEGKNKRVAHIALK